MTIIAFIGMFAGVGISSSGADVATALALVGGVAIGSAAWWLFLTLLVSRIRHRLSPDAIRLINLGSSAIIVAFGMAALLAAR